VKVVREANPARLIVAVPVAPRDSYENLRAKVDEIVCLSMPEPFYAWASGTRISSRLPMKK